MQATAFAQAEFARIMLSSLIIASYTFLTAYELRRERRRALARPLLTIGVPLLHGMVFLSPALLTALLPPGTADGWFALFALETLLYVVGTAFIVVVMAKERMLLAHKTAAMTDALTGLFNRRAFLAEAQQMIARQARANAPVTVLMFDLDHFKSINDRFGHAVGDDALRLFAQTAVGNMRGNDVFGRLGGEEFAAIIAGPQSEAAVVAERVRAAFEAAGVDISGHDIGATVSIGLAEQFPPAAIEGLLARADAALYRAKEKGRNRIETSLPAAPVQPPPLVPALEPVPA
jgi:diguanylate cyclase (GGDEF)-like protein